MRRLAAFLTCLIALAGPLAAGQPDKPTAVLELFTSQGCSSCPSADALFIELARDPRYLVLTLPVDYWDYLGWRDTLAHAAFTQRQRHYAKSRGDGHIYTPQAVINGVSHAIGSDRSAIEQAARGAGVLPLDVVVQASGDGFMVSISGPAGAVNSGSVWIVPVARHRSVTVQRGENRGRELAYGNVARALTRLSSWRGEAMTLNVPASLTQHADADTFVVLVHAESGRLGRIVGAARAPGF